MMSDEEKKFLEAVHEDIRWQITCSAIIIVVIEMVILAMVLPLK